MRLLAVRAAAAMLALVALGPTAEVRAQDASEAPEAGAAPEASPNAEQFTASHLALAQDVIELTGVDEPFDDILPRLADQTQAIFIRSNPALTREIEETVMEVALGMAQRRVELSRTLQLVWARRFSEDELAELKAFFGSDLGAKFVGLTPNITRLAIGAARQWEERLAARMVEATRAALREKGFAL